MRAWSAVAPFALVAAGCGGLTAGNSDALDSGSSPDDARVERTTSGDGTVRDAARDAGDTRDSSSVHEASAPGPCGDAGSGIQVLASTDFPPVGPVVDSKYVYWVEGTRLGRPSPGSLAVKRVPLCGGTVETVVSERPDGGTLLAQSIALDDENVYWIEESDPLSGCAPGASSVLKQAKRGGTPTVLASNRPHAFDLVVSSGRLFWIENTFLLDGGTCSGGGLMSIATTGGVPQAIVIGPVFSLVTQGSDVYYSEDSAGAASTVMIPSTGGMPVTLAEGNLRVAAAGPKGIYLWAYDCPYGGYCTSVDLVTVPLRGGMPVTTATSVELLPQATAADDRAVYWTSCENDCSSGDGGVYSIPLGGGKTSTLAAGVIAAGGLALDSTSLYWTANRVLYKLTPK